jgi:proline iminopeptidase
MRELYPPLEARRSGWIDTGDGHEVWFEDCGAIDGLPVVFLHGGPGSGCKPSHRQFFDPARYRIVLLDQRGCGRSRPLGRVAANSTERLVDDLEALRRALAIERWVVFGGSWGATLALCYASEHASRVLAMVLRGSFLARSSDIDWFFRDGASRLFPEAWMRLRDSVPAGERGELFAALYGRVFSDDTSERDAAVRSWSQWGSTVALSNMPPVPGAAKAGDVEPLATSHLVASTRIEFHYAAARYFLSADPALSRAARCPRVPTFIIHGERDFTCVPESAFSLHAAMPWARLTLLPETGHLASEPRMTDALVRVMDEIPLLLA